MPTPHPFTGDTAARASEAAVPQVLPAEVTARPLRVVASQLAAARLADAVDLAPRIRVDRVLDRADVATVARSAVDLAVVDATEPGARTLARLLRAAGVCVWWLDATDGHCPGVGAAAVVSASLTTRDLDVAAEAAARPGAGLTTTIAVSVVITTLNEGTSMDLVLDLVVAQLRADDEVVVIDGGSTDGSVERVRETWRHDPRVRIHVEPGAGISEGRNHGIRAAVHDVLVCTDAGCTPYDGWLDAMRAAFAGADRPGLASGPSRSEGDSALDRAQAMACYYDPHEVRRRDLAVLAWTSVFGTGFDPRYSWGRNMAFTRQAWSDAGGFPEHLATGEDVGFGLAIARDHRCVAVADAGVDWGQRDDIAATWRMYRGYGRASTDGGDTRLLIKDGIRGASYVAALALAVSGARGRALVALGGAAYLSLPVRRAVRADSPAAVYPLLPVALATKDLGKLAGALQGFARARKRASGAGRPG